MPENIPLYSLQGTIRMPGSLDFQLERKIKENKARTMETHTQEKHKQLA